MSGCLKKGFESRSTLGRLFFVVGATLAEMLMLVAMTIDGGAQVGSHPVEVLLFGRLRDIAGRNQIAVVIDDGATVRDLWLEVSGTHPRLVDCASVRPALNERFASWDAGVRGGDRVAFLPPMSGG